MLPLMRDSPEAVLRAPEAAETGETHCRLLRGRACPSGTPGCWQGLAKAGGGWLEASKLPEP